MDHFCYGLFNGTISQSKKLSSENSVAIFDIRYFKPPFIGIYSKLTQKGLTNYPHGFVAMLKIYWFLEVKRHVLYFHEKILFQVNKFLRLRRSLFVLAVKLVILSQPVQNLATRTDGNFDTEKKSHIITTVIQVI